MALTVVGIFILHRRDREPPTYSTPGYPLTPIVFLLLLAVMLFLLAAGQPKQSFLGMGVVLLGVPVYYLLFRRKQEPQSNEVSTTLR
jgi:APA family basic amino acid/polyamine antiporter